MARTGGAERRAEFVQTAQQLFYTKGYESTSVNDIIKSVGVSKGAFYHHFDSKDEVLIGVVSVVVEQTAAVIEPILADEMLTAIEKFNRMINDVGDWKSQRREQLVPMIRMMYSNENLHLRSRLHTETFKILVPVLARIFEQGIKEGSFDLGGISAEDTAELIVTLWRTTSEAAIYMILDPERQADAADIVIRKYEATQKIFERILDAPPGSLQIVNQKIFRSWFE